MVTTEERIRSFAETFERWAYVPALPDQSVDLKMASAYMIAGIRHDKGMQSPELLDTLCNTTLTAEAPWVRSRCLDLLVVLAHDTPGYAAAKAAETLGKATADKDPLVAAAAVQKLAELSNAGTTAGQASQRRRPSAQNVP